ncbi:site-2 protease family protein [Desulfovibrio subterraneus]|uniref:Peptidase M50 n=1 Tax=Desulfovibrio subterraneus TaxID=2718620 RepID=A0A7J0BMY7_9BACT|nr:site-2 protease family protein [Desulfovibrio subterraneus]GFM34611.1 peptidase M50 [Desulfovibrio subterraneus]
MFDLDLALSVRKISVALIPMLLGMVCHEVAHGWVAWKHGDPTAKSLGRLTLNPLPHIDPMGTLVFILTALTSPFVIGWAKPVPVNPRYFSNPRKGMMLVSVAGPAANFLLAILFAMGYRLAGSGMLMPGGVQEFLLAMCATGVWINLTLCWFNLMPIPPLDGSKIAAGFMPPHMAYKYLQIERYGLIVVMILLASGLLGKVVWPLVDGSADLISALIGIR